MLTVLYIHRRVFKINRDVLEGLQQRGWVVAREPLEGMWGPQYLAENECCVGFEALYEMSAYCRGV